MGIMAGSTSPRNIQIIQDNTLHPNVSITNGYALAVSSNVQLLNNAVNTLTSGSSRRDRGVRRSQLQRRDHR